MAAAIDCRAAGECRAGCPQGSGRNHHRQRRAACRDVSLARRYGEPDPARRRDAPRPTPRTPHTLSVMAGTSISGRSWYPYCCSRSAGDTFTAKDFAPGAPAASALAEAPSVQSKGQAQRQVRHAVEQVARALGNTATICRKCYVHPAVIEARLTGVLVRAQASSPAAPSAKTERLHSGERLVLSCSSSWGSNLLTAVRRRPRATRPDRAGGVMVRHLAHIADGTPLADVQAKGGRVVSH
jgi:hypothetical protein